MKQITNENLTDFTTSETLSLIKFSGTWCGPCKVLKPILDEISNEVVDAIIGEVDVDQLPEITRQYGIRNIPAILFFKNGQIVDTQMGLTTKTELLAKIEKNK